MMTLAKAQNMQTEVADLLRDIRAEAPHPIDIEETRLDTWFERDRAHIAPMVNVEGREDETIVEWWDDDVAQAIEDGFLPHAANDRTVRDYAYDYASERGLLPAGAPMEITISTSDGESWNYQTGDNSYTGACYGDHYWGVSSIARDDDSETCDAIAEDLVNQIADQMVWED